MNLPISQKNDVGKATVIKKEPSNVTKDDIVKEIVMNLPISQKMMLLRKYLYRKNLPMSLR